MLWGIQSENRRIPARSSVAITRSSDGASRMTARESPDGRQAWALYRHWLISVRWPRWHRAVIGRRLPDLRSMTCGFFPLHFGRWPPDRRSMIGRCPTGCRRMRKSGEESADHPANFNCELTLPDHRRMSPGWVPNRRMAAGFLQDSSPGSPHGDPAIEFAQLWRSFYVNCISAFFVSPGIHYFQIENFLCILRCSLDACSLYVRSLDTRSCSLRQSLEFNPRPCSFFKAWIFRLSL